jgi:hypothetical protein
MGWRSYPIDEVMNGNFLVQTMGSTILGNYREGMDYRGEVSRRVLDRYQKPERKPWQDYDLGQ